MEQAKVPPWLKDTPELMSSRDVTNQDVNGDFADLAKSPCPVEPQNGLGWTGS